MKSKYLRTIQLFLVGMMTLVFSQCSYIAKIQEDREKVRSDLKNLCDSLPTPNGLRKYDEGGIFKPEGGSFTNTFKTNLDCKAATSPYYEYLNSNGWLPIKAGSPYYYKGNYVINASCRSNMSDSSEQIVQVGCSWDQSGETINYHK